MKDRLVGVNQVVTFNGALSKDPDGIISEYSWDFGDGETGTGVQVRHQYKKAGRYTVALKVLDNTDLSNNSDLDTLNITVNEAPKPVITGGGIVCAGDKVSLSGKGSFDPDGEIIKYTWNFGDGSLDSSGMDVNHTYGSPGNYTVTLNVDDGGSVNNSLSQTSTTVIVNEPPVAKAGLDRIVSTEEKVMFNGSTAKDRDGAIDAYEWDFGDGSHAKGIIVSHGYKAPGKYLVRLLVTDNSGTECNSAEDVATIRVNAPPVGVIEGELETVYGKAHIPVFFDATGSYDPDGDPITFFWDFGDGKSAKGPKVNHSFDKPGKYTVKLRVDDGTGLKSSVRWREVSVQVR
jgi:PKD repeat protein